MYSDIVDVPGMVVQFDSGCDGVTLSKGAQAVPFEAGTMDADDSGAVWSTPCVVKAASVDEATICPELLDSVVAAASSCCDAVPSLDD